GCSASRICSASFPAVCFEYGIGRGPAPASATISPQKGCLENFISLIPENRSKIIHHRRRGPRRLVLQRRGQEQWCRRRHDVLQPTRGRTANCVVHYPGGKYYL